MKIVSRFLVCMSVFVSLAFAGSASAQSVPLLCSAKPAQVAKYNNGLAAGQQKAETFFASTEIAKSPKKVQAKIARVLERLHQHIRDAMTGEVGLGKRCRVQGVADGFLGRLAQLVGQCIIDGGTWGQFAAELYCELSMELGGLAQAEGFVRTPVGLCGTLFQQVCDNVYGYVATEGAESISPSVKTFLQSRGVSVSIYQTCAEFTEGTFEDVFESSRAVDCAYGAR